MGEVEIRTPALSAGTCRGCGGWCAPFVREYPDERGRWWVVCEVCGTNYPIDDDRLSWRRRDADTGAWHRAQPPTPAQLDRVLGR